MGSKYKFPVRASQPRKVTAPHSTLREQAVRRARMQREADRNRRLLSQIEHDSRIDAFTMRAVGRLLGW